MAGHPNSFGTRSILTTDEGPLTCYSLSLLEQAGFSGIDRLPYSIRILLENLLRHEDGFLVTSRDIEKMALWGQAGESVYAGKGAASGFHGRAGYRGFGSHARCGPEALRKPFENQSADSRRTRY